MGFRFFAYHLFVHLAAGWNVDDNITQNLSGTRKAPPVGQGLGRTEILLDLANGRQAGYFGNQPMLGKLPFRHQHLAAPANTASATDRVNIDPE